MPRVVILGAGLAGLAAAAALGEDREVDVLEARPFAGGRATSWPVNPADPQSEIVDNCQHVLLRCCVNLRDFYRRLGAENEIRFYDEFHYLEPGGRRSVLRRGSWPAPLHFAGSFHRLRFLGWKDKLAIARALAALRHERTRRTDLDRISMLDWLLQKRQTPAALERFWKPVLVSAINEELDRFAASHGFQVFWLGFLASAEGYEMGVPAVPLGELYAASRWSRLPNVRFHFRTPVERVHFQADRVLGVTAGSRDWQADGYICALPFERMAPVAPELNIAADRFQHSPITSVHVWYDRQVTALPHAILLDRNLQWMFNKREGRYLQFVISASRELAAMSRPDVVAIALSEAREFFPEAARAEVVKTHVIKEIRATFSAAPGAAALRSAATTRFPNLFLAGDWTGSGWPATMEGAVRSGYLAAEAAAGAPGRFLLPDIA